MSRLGNRIQRDIEEGEFESHTAYGRACGLSQQVVSNWVSGKTLNANDDKLAKISGARGIPLEELQALRDQDMIESGRMNRKGNIPASARAAVAKINGPLRAGKIMDLPIRGLSAGGDMERVVFSSNDIYDWADRPGALVGVEGAYGVEMREMSMAPRYRPNKDIIHVNPGAPAYAGDDVVVHVRDRSSNETLGFVKEFNGWDGDKAIFKQLNPPKTIKFNRVDIVSIDLIIGTGRK